jgi:FkbH-like protein
VSLLEVRSKWLRLAKASDVKDAKQHVAIAATFTAEPIIPYLGCGLVESGIAARVSTLAYDQLHQLCANWRALCGQDKPSALVLLWRIEDLLRTSLQGFVRGDTNALSSALDEVTGLGKAVGHLRSTFPGSIVVSTPPFPHSPDHHIHATRSVREVGAFHRRVVDEWLTWISKVGNVSILDIDGLQRYCGIERSLDHRKWYLYRQPYSELFWNELGRHLAAILVRQRVAPKKCIIVDCDNTLWGGVIGEDGLSGIALGDDYPGSVFRDFQHQLLTLRSQGVMVALCSKNNEADVWEVFNRHDGMLLKRDHIVAHRINWQDKASNICSLSEELNIGLDSLVFVDDSSFEIAHIGKALPTVTCLQVPNDLALFPHTISSCRLFDQEHISEEDRVRSVMIVQERDRKTLSAAMDPKEFRRALELVVEIFECGPEHIGRVTQLINKTNQFNLTTRRKTAAEVEALCRDALWDVLAVRVSDRFGDYGLVGVIILRTAEQTIEIETLLMSCRVLGRGVEEAIFAKIGEIARRDHADKIIGEFIPTKKNALVADLYKVHHFASQPDGVHWIAHDFSALVWPDHIRQTRSIAQVMIGVRGDEGGPSKPVEAGSRTAHEKPMFTG